MNFKSDGLAEDLANELAAMAEGDSERLCKILRGLLSCLSDLNTRIEALEGEQQRNAQNARDHIVPQREAGQPLRGWRGGGTEKSWWRSSGAFGGGNMPK